MFMFTGLSQIEHSHITNLVHCDSLLTFIVKFFLQTKVILIGLNLNFFFSPVVAQIL